MKDAIIYILNLVIIAGMWFVYQYLKQLPDHVHQRNLKAFELDLNKQLESFKLDLTRELELLKINESNLYIYKAGEYVKLVEFMLVNMLDKAYIKKLSHDVKTQQEFNRQMMAMGTKLFFFASDETVKKFVEWRVYGLKADEPGFDSNMMIVSLAELIVLIRKDLGYENTACNIDDFLNILLTDWDKHKEKYGL